MEGEAFVGHCIPETAYEKDNLKVCLPETMVDCSHISSTTSSPSTTDSKPSEWDYLCIGVEPYYLIPHPMNCKKVDIILIRLPSKIIDSYSIFSKNSFFNAWQTRPYQEIANMTKRST